MDFELIEMLAQLEIIRYALVFKFDLAGSDVVDHLDSVESAITDFLSKTKYTQDEVSEWLDKIIKERDYTKLLSDSHDYERRFAINSWEECYASKFGGEK